MARYRYNHNNKKYRSKKRIKNIALSLLLVLALVLPMGMIVSSGAAEWKDANPVSWFAFDVNPDNLISPENVENYVKSGDTNRGLKYKVNDNGKIVFSGKATSAGTLAVCTVNLDPGTYTLSGIKNPNVDVFSLYASYGTTGQIAFADTDSATFVIDTPQTVNIIVAWDSDFNPSLLNNTLKPVLVKGDVAGDFYA